jgi:hypothetical protein
MLFFIHANRIQMATNAQEQNKHHTKILNVNGVGAC